MEKKSDKHGKKAAVKKRPAPGTEPKQPERQAETSAKPEALATEPNPDDVKKRRAAILERINKAFEEDDGRVTSEAWVNGLKETLGAEAGTVDTVLAGLRTDLANALRNGKTYLLKGFGAFSAKEEDGKTKFLFTPTKSLSALVKK